MTLGENLRNARRKAGLVQKQVAKLLNISTSVYSDYETGKREPSASRLKQLSSVLHVSLDELLETNYMPNSIEPSNEELFIVVEVYDRTTEKAALCHSIKEAVVVANEFLEEHIEDLGYSDDYEEGDGEGDEWDLATTDNLNAWCNWDDMDWDAYIIHI